MTCPSLAKAVCLGFVVSIPVDVHVLAQRNSRRDEHVADAERLIVGINPFTNNAHRVEVANNSQRVGIHRKMESLQQTRLDPSGRGCAERFIVGKLGPRE